MKFQTFIQNDYRILERDVKETITMYTYEDEDLKNVEDGDTLIDFAIPQPMTERYIDSEPSFDILKGNEIIKRNLTKGELEKYIEAL